ncbi:MAG: aminopeptidase [Rhodobacterales bacterium]|nr:aminopeptidase [Rhodobacterales bacterium]
MILLTMLISLCCVSATAHDAHHDGFQAHQHHAEMPDVIRPEPGEDPFRQLTELLPDPNNVRLASGAPGPSYWQNEADHVIDVQLDPETHTLTGSERITYHNHSPHSLTYLWVQLDQNKFREDSIARRSETGPNLDEDLSPGWLARAHAQSTFQGGMTIDAVVDSAGKPLPHTIVDTMMRVDLPRPLKPGGTLRLGIDWSHRIVPEAIWARSRVEVLDDGLPLYEVAQWFPRMEAYTDIDGWQNKPFVGSGEFTLEFGRYILNITVPDTFVVAGTGELKNASEVLTRAQQARLQKARTAKAPVMIITAEEAEANESRTPTGTRTWTFEANQVRDVAGAASPSVLWDAWGVEVPGTGRTTMAMSYYPEEGEPLWSKYSTQAVAHTVEVYSELATPYPWPVAISVNGPVGGMEYPMICFNGPRPEEDGTYTERTKYGLIGVIIHEVGHNWFPMIINSDERQWTWMDEGLNTYGQFVAEQAWEETYPSRRGEPRDITSFMGSSNQRPIMTNSESLLQFGNNAYAKPATALNVLRETVLGRELFDHAFRTYSERWAFKRPQPHDFFRTFEDASGTDLDWFWRGWFYTTGHVDIALTDVRRYALRGDPERAATHDKYTRDELLADSLTTQRNAGAEVRTHRFPELLDFYNDYDALDPTPIDTLAWTQLKRSLEDDERAAVEAFDERGFFYAVHLENQGGVVMPVPMRLVYEDGTEETLLLPAEIWRRNNKNVVKVILSDKALSWVEIDTFGQIADTDQSDNRWPQSISEHLVRIRPDDSKDNPMQQALATEAREVFRPMSTLVAKSLYTAWLAAVQAHTGDNVLVPAGVLEELEQAVSDHRDPWNQSLRFAFAKDPEPFEELAKNKQDAGEVRLATFRSSGADGAFETHDDIVWRIMADGNAQE